MTLKERLENQSRHIIEVKKELGGSLDLNTPLPLFSDITKGVQSFKSIILESENAKAGIIQALKSKGYSVPNNPTWDQLIGVINNIKTTFSVRAGMYHSMDGFHDSLGYDGVQALYRGFTMSIPGSKVLNSTGGFSNGMIIIN